MESPLYKKATREVTSIEITVTRENGEKQFMAFTNPEKIKDLVENEPFFKSLTTLT